MIAGVNPATRSYAAALGALTAPAARRFESALHMPERAQRASLARVLRAVAGSRQANRIAGFTRIRTAREFQDAVPLATYGDLAADIRDMARGVPAVLSLERVLRLERSGGSSGPAKYVPHTPALIREFQAALLPWLFDLARSRPRAWDGPAYWSISPLGQRREHTPGGLPLGVDDDSAYFPAAVRRLLGPHFAVPGTVALLSDVETCRYATLRVLLEREDLAFVSVWNPSFLTLLIENADRHVERLLDDLAAGTCRPPGDSGAARDPRTERDASARGAALARLPVRSDPERACVLRRALEPGGRFAPGAAWPELALISAWTDAQAARALPALRARFPEVEMQGKGLLATEGVVSIPWFEAPAPVLAVRGHFLEFIDSASPAARPRLAHELEAGRSFEVVLSTGAGFLRYRLGDRVRVEGHYGRTPCVRFAGRADAVSDLVGEKLAASRVSEVLDRVLERSGGDAGGRSAGRAGGAGAPRFAMLAPEWGEPPAYRLYIESDAGDEVVDSWARGVEDGLLEDFSYRYARDLGQLGALTAVRVEDAARRYEARCLTQGQRAGDIKPVDLALHPGWGTWLA